MNNNLESLDKQLNSYNSYDINFLQKTGDGYFSCGNYKKAFVYYNKMFEQQPDYINIEVFEKMGDCHFFRIEYDSAISYYEKVIEQTPNNADVLEKLGDCYYYGNLNTKKAIDYYKIAIERIFEIYNNRSNKYFTDEEKRSIFHCYKRINKFDSENIEALSVLGLCYKNGVGTKKDKTQAIFCFKRASELSKDDKEQLFCYKNIFELSPNDSENCEKLVDYYLYKNTEKNIEEYIVYYKKYTEIGSYKNKKIQCCKKIIEKETDKIEVFEYRVKLSEFDSTDADNWKELGDCYLDIGIDKYKAIDCYKEFCKLSKDNGKRFNYYEKIYELNSQDIKNLVNLADSYRYGNGIEISVSKAIAFYKKAIDCTSDYEIKILLYERINELDTTDTYVIQKLAEYYCTKGKISYYKKAYLQYKKLTELDSNSANYWEQLGYCYEYGLGTERNNNEAINCYKKVIKLEMDYGHKQKFCEKIIKLNPNDTYALNNLGDLWYKKGNKNKASEFYEKVIEIDPNYVRSYYGLKNCYNGEKKFECLLKIHELNPDDKRVIGLIADCYAKGIWTEKNTDKAFLYNKKLT